MTLEEAKKLVGTRVCVGEYCGILDSVGYNDVLQRLQVCIGRMPIEIKSYSDIKIFKIKGHE